MLQGFLAADPFRIWFVRVPLGQFESPKFHFGQLVIHWLEVPGGQIGGSATVVGMTWLYDHWEYDLEFLPGHPEYQDNQQDDWISGCWVEDWQIESIDLAYHTSDIYANNRRQV